MYLCAWLVGFAILFGVCIVLLFGQPQPKYLSSIFGLSIGIMTFVIFGDLFPSSYQYGNIYLTIGGFCLGIAMLDILERLLHHSTHDLHQYKNQNLLKTGILVAIGIGLHDIPEGIALSVGFHAHESIGISLALAIGIHHIPEGIITALPLKLAGLSNLKILLLALFISLLTPFSALLGQLLIGNFQHLIGLLLGTAAGSMFYIIVHELLPQSLKSNKNFAILGIILGFVFMLSYNLIFGHSCINH